MVRKRCAELCDVPDGVRKRKRLNSVEARENVERGNVERGPYRESKADAGKNLLLNEGLVIARDGNASMMGS